MFAAYRGATDLSDKGSDDEEDEILYQANPDPLVDSSSRRSSLESMDEPELTELIHESRPGTAVSHPSTKTARSDRATHGSPECPIEIPHVSHEAQQETAGSKVTHKNVGEEKAVRLAGGGGAQQHWSDVKRTNDERREDGERSYRQGEMDTRHDSNKDSARSGWAVTSPTKR